MDVLHFARPLRSRHGQYPLAASMRGLQLWVNIRSIHCQRLIYGSDQHSSCRNGTAEVNWALVGRGRRAKQQKCKLDLLVTAQSQSVNIYSQQSDTVYDGERVWVCSSNDPVTSSGRSVCFLRTYSVSCVWDLDVFIWSLLIESALFKKAVEAAFLLEINYIGLGVAKTDKNWFYKCAGTAIVRILAGRGWPLWGIWSML